jgi:glycosyltransferase involved in cell wall biosynthesis
MFAGIPVVGTRLGGFLDLVEEGETGFLVKANDPEALAARIRLLMVDDSLARAMGTAARRRAVQCFSMEHTLRRYVNCYREISQ